MGEGVDPGRPGLAVDSPLNGWRGVGIVGEATVRHGMVGTDGFLANNLDFFGRN